MRVGGIDRLDERVWTAHGDAWQAEGRLRESLGGGVAEFPGSLPSRVRLRLGDRLGNRRT